MERSGIPVRFILWLGAAENRCWIPLKYWIDRYHGQPMLQGLAHQHAVKGVSVHRRQYGEMADTRLVKGQAGNLMPCTLGGEVGLGRMR